MKNLLLFFVVMLSLSNTEAQNFCGLIKYRYTYYNPKNNKNVTKKTNDFKTEDFYICGNKFKVYFDGELKDIFIGDSLTFIHMAPDSTAAFIRADSTYGQELVEYTNFKTGVPYKNKLYNTVENNDEGGNSTYYFTDQVSINPLMFIQVELYQWNKFFEATHGGLRQIFINKAKDLTTVSEAIEIVPLPLTNKDFEIPPIYSIKPFRLLEIIN